jgi:1-acyl-sn-glycerol-3-phosphate acyltransferase
MLKTAYFFFIFWIGLMLSLILLLFILLLWVFRFHKAKKKFVHFIIYRWARFTLFTAGIKLALSGMENIPESHTGFVVVSNHQGNFDIPVFIGSLPFTAGFIAKKEIRKLPFLNIWMMVQDCLFIDRSKPRESGRKISERIRQTNKNPIFLFPEGTRSKGPQMGPFKTGSLKLIFHGQIDVLPVTISGSYKCYEECNNVKSALVKVFFHPVLHSSQYEHTEFERFILDLQKIIEAPLIENLKK